MAETWLTAEQLADALGLPVERVRGALRATGLQWASRRHARGEGDAREYSLAVQRLVVRELRSCEHEAADA